MNSQEIRALQEAYNQVYGLDEEKVELKQRNKNEMQRKAGNLGREVVSSKKGPKRTAAMNRMGKLVSSIARDDEEKRFKTLGQSPAHNEAVDLYDIILSHLLDEGYADTEQAAEAIMVNMSEDWRESICEGYVELNKKRQRRMTDSAMRKMDSDKWEQAYSIENERDTQTPEVSQAKAAANKKRGEGKRKG
jgi:hypothetical protein